jgi:carboxypeptidase Taq
MHEHPEEYRRLVEHLRKTALLRSCSHLLSWDEQTCMPSRGAEFRAEQAALLAGLVHDQVIAPQVADWLAELHHFEREIDPESPTAAVLREARRGYDRAARLPRRLVEELSYTATLAQRHWVEARQQAEFGLFRPWLARQIALKREEADALGAPVGGVLYDALLDEYEPGGRTLDIEPLFRTLREAAVDLLGAIRGAARRPSTELLTRRFPIDAQRTFARAAAQAVGFDFTAGRLDESAHPFCTALGPGDTRLTTRYNELHFPGAFFGVLHEAGHGIYDQGLPSAHFGTALGEATSLGIHESQSRTFENLVGRSRSFWECFFPRARQAFPAALADVSLDEFYFAINDVRPSWIRVEADEVTYNLHIMLRFELEQRLVAGSLSADDLPDAWNDAFRRDFGMTPPNAALGCLQDVHWSAGLLGYFPTYTLGNMYAAQFFEQARSDLGDLDAQFAEGSFAPLKQWLNDNIHGHGHRYRAARLVEIVTGRPLSPLPLIQHLNRKFRPLFGVE